MLCIRCAKQVRSVSWWQTHISSSTAIRVRTIWKHTHARRRLLPGGQTLQNIHKKGEYIRIHLSPCIPLSSSSFLAARVVATCRAIPNMGSTVFDPSETVGCRSIEGFVVRVKILSSSSSLHSVLWTYNRLYLSSIQIDNCIEIVSGLRRTNDTSVRQPDIDRIHCKNE